MLCEDSSVKLARRFDNSVLRRFLSDKTGSWRYSFHFYYYMGLKQTKPSASHQVTTPVPTVMEISDNSAAEFQSSQIMSVSWSQPFSIVKCYTFRKRALYITSQGLFLMRFCSCIWEPRRDKQFQVLCIWTDKWINLNCRCLHRCSGLFWAFYFWSTLSMFRERLENKLAEVWPKCSQVP